MPPQWFITTSELNRYLRGAIRKGWDPEHIRCLAEAFAVAGCDFTSFLHTSKAKADWIKGEIRDKINTMLVEITGNLKAIMNYVNYEKDIVLRYGIELQGWTHEKFVNPSDLSMSLPPLEKLHAAIKSGDCPYYNKLEEGSVPQRKKRKDAGKPRGSHAKKDDEDNQTGERPAKRARTGAAPSEIVNSEVE
ncbi:hypothetical protein OBBRIDRAFT_839892 [Obba rivulosa]|uniref:Uncharacterized protein n=1 Tax=Obba rivulosa TaxID=1052685 RepID=A0A8E2ALT0_9APHY|nr:hypothetical protein OBBRIDRAFT_839892 [Obba rivulosa]